MCGRVGEHYVSLSRVQAGNWLIKFGGQWDKDPLPTGLSDGVSGPLRQAFCPLKIKLSSFQRAHKFSKTRSAGNQRILAYMSINTSIGFDMFDPIIPAHASFH